MSAAACPYVLCAIHAAASTHASQAEACSEGKALSAGPGHAREPHLSSVCSGGKVDKHERLGVPSQARLKQVRQPAVPVWHMRLLGSQSCYDISCPMQPPGLRA